MIFGSNLNRKLGALVDAHVKQGTFSGSVLVVKNKKVVLRKGYGRASVELDVPVTPEHAFRIGSVAKILTAAAVLRLVDAGRVSVDDRLSTFLPDFPDAERVMLHHLLSNTSGIADHITREDAAWWCGRPHTLPVLIDLIAEAPRLFEPGSRFSYSNANWALLAAVLEHTTQKPFAEALSELVLTPLGLTRTTVGVDHPLVRGRASGYQLDDRAVRPAAHIDLSVEIGAGGVYSTVDDLYRLENALAEDGFLTSATRRRMLTPTTQDASMGYGYGVMTGQRFGRAWWGHSGGTFGFTSFLTHYPAEDVTVIVLSNFDNGSAAGLAQDLAAVVFGEPYSLPSDVPEVSVAGNVLAAYEGTYQTEFAGRSIPARVELVGDYLCVTFPLLPAARLRALSPTRFQGRLKGGEVTFEFVVEGERISGVELDWAGHAMFAPRVDRT